MKILTSESAGTKLVSFLQAVYGFKKPDAEKIATTIESISKEKIINTEALDLFLAFARKATKADIEGAIKMQKFQALKDTLKAIHKTKTFQGTVDALKRFKFKETNVASGQGRQATYDSITSLLANIQDSNEGGDKAAAQAFNKIFKTKFSYAGVGASNYDEGIYLKAANEVQIVIARRELAYDLANTLGVKSGECFAYIDTYADEGPFLGEARPVEGSVVSGTFKQVIQAVTKPAYIAKMTSNTPAPKGYAHSDDYEMTLVDSERELRQEFDAAAKRLGIVGRVVSVGRSQAGYFLAKLAFLSAADKAVYDKDYNGEDD